MDPKCTLLDEDAAPDTLCQVILGDQPAFGLSQFRKNLEGTTAQRNGLSHRAQFASGKIDLPFSASVDGALVWLGHHRHSPRRLLDLAPSVSPTHSKYTICPATKAARHSPQISQCSHVSSRDRWILPASSRGARPPCRWSHPSRAAVPSSDDQPPPMTGARCRASSFPAQQRWYRARRRSPSTCEIPCRRGQM